MVKAILNADTNTLKQVWASEFLVNNPRNDISGNRDTVLLTQQAGMINIVLLKELLKECNSKKKL